jgi:ribonuclease P protein component
MLKKVNRLAKARDIQKVFSRGRAFFNPQFGIKFLPSSKPPRFTVVVSTKVFKKAVARNRLKRVVREYLRKHLTKFPGGDYMVIFKPKIAGLPENEVLKNFIAVANTKLKKP